MSDLAARLHYPDPRPGEDRLLLVMLPGAGMMAEDFAARGFVNEVQHGGAIVDMIAAQPDQTLYLDGTVAQVLETAVLAPARAVGYRRIWLLGISLGGMGALACAATHDGSVQGLILLAPFIGTHATVRELSRAGGFAGWQPATSAATMAERKILIWMKSYLAGGSVVPALWLGYASQDRFAAGHTLLAGALQQDRAVQVEGGHDWTAWRAAFHGIIARKPFG